MSQVKGAVVAAVVPGSIAASVGLEPNDRLLAINGQPMEDLIDYKYLCSDEELVLHVQKADGTEWEIEIEKEYDEDLGLEFTEATFDAMRRCANRCVFCFVNQNPPGMRSSLYVYDDDYRLSFLNGYFITLTNLRQRDWERIARLRLSPLYVSVHTTNPELRVKMLGSKRAGDIMKHLAFFREHRLQIHAQIVLCPGWNDGAELDRTIADLASYYPTVLSVAVVPVGLTRFRTGLPELRPFTRAEVTALAEHIRELQDANLAALGTRFVWLSDEFFITYGLPLPPRGQYEDMPQTENGVGVARLFIDEFHAALAATGRRPRLSHACDIVTGVLGAKVLAPLVAELTGMGVAVQLRPVPNRFFGETITAAGLVTGRDCLDTLRDQPLGQELLFPEVMLRLRADDRVFLDDIKLADVEKTLGVRARVLASAEELVKYLVS